MTKSPKHRWIRNGKELTEEERIHRFAEIKKEVDEEIQREEVST